MEEEEDWSTFVESTTGFAQHEEVAIRVSDTRNVHLQCVSSLSPLDMMYLSSGKHDATGQRIWMGALFLVEVLATRGDESLHRLLERCFLQQHVLELGCGTGVAGLALMLAPEEYRPSFVHFTDSDHDVLELCHQNCIRNTVRADGNKSKRRWAVEKLEWGCQNDTARFVHNVMIDTILATDVLYDVSSLSPLLHTVQALLRPGGYFVLAHVPRASLPGQGRVATMEEMERYILSQIPDYCLGLVGLIRPDELRNMKKAGAPGLNSVSLKAMHEAGAALLLFQSI